jgi:hypothetical protein
MSECKKTFDLFFIKDNLIKKVKLEHAIFELYHLRCRLPTQNELDLAKINRTVDDMKKELSEVEENIPLYDAFTSNIYIIQKRNVYIRVINHDYRFPDDLIMESVKKTREKRLKKISKHPELKNDAVYVRSIRKTNQMLDFMNYFNKEILYSTYLKVFYRYAPEIGNATYTCIRKSFIPHKDHLKPYYTRDEVIKLGMNMELVKIPDKMSYVDYKDSLTRDDYKDICSKIQLNDVSADILIKHQNYIVNENMVGLIQYYTIQGSYFMNQYLRGYTKYEYRNDYLEENIVKIWELVLNAPAFDNDYIVYRFISSDDYLRHLKVGMSFRDKGFTSTTRDPFYRNDLYKFGFILIKIKIPKDIRGVGLCLETLSHFPMEEEIILPPLTELKLVSKDQECEYNHPDEEYASSIKSRYEFVWVGNMNSNMPYLKRPIMPKDQTTKIVDFLVADKIRTITLREKIDFLIKKYCDPMNRIKCKIGEHLEVYVVAEWYDSTGPYVNMYSLKTSEGFSLYSIYQGYILFMIEIAEIESYPQLRINYFTKYSRLDRQEIMGDDNFIRFISSIAYYFDIPTVVIYADYMSCDRLASSNISRSNSKHRLKNNDKTKLLLTDIKYAEQNSVPLEGVDGEEGYNKSKQLSRKQRTYMNNANSSDRMFSKSSRLADGSTAVNHQNDTIIIDEDTDTFTGGSYCSDFYKYFKYGEKRYEATNTLNVELQPKFSYYDLDMLKTVEPSKILKKNDRDEVYQIYVKNYVLETSAKYDNLADFYVWMIENKCYLMDIFVKKLDKLYRDENPFKKGMYVLDAMAYLYNRRYVNAYSRYIKMMIDEEHQLLTLPRNDYRIRR